MAPQYSSKHLLRLVLKALLGRYFHPRNLLRDIAFDELAETEVDGIYEAIQALPGDQRSLVDSDFQAVNDLASTTGMRALVQAAKSVNQDLGEAFSASKDVYAKAFSCLLKHEAVFNLALRFWETDNLSERYWVRRAGVPLVEPDVSPTSVGALGVHLQMYFLREEGRGYNCYVDCYPREGDLNCYVYLEDHGRAGLEFIDEGGPPQRRTRRPAFSIVFAYSPTKGRLDTNYRGSRKTIHELQRLFAFPILGIALDAPRKSARVYDLDQLKDRSFPWVYERSWHIRQVLVNRLRLSAVRGIGRHITVAGDTRRKSDIVYDLLEDTFAVDTGPQRPGQKLALSEYQVTQAEIKVEFDASYRRQSRPFTLTAPDSCTLGLLGDDDDARIRQMLVLSGLERT